MEKGRIGVTSDNIFPIIKKFLYSDQEIFLREMISNAIDATQKLKTLALAGNFKGELGDLTIRVKLDKEEKTITISDRGIGMTAEEIEKYINEIAFSSAGEFVNKYKDKVSSIIGHFGLGFYSAFMVAEKVDIITRSHNEDAKPVKWSCEGTPEFTLEETQKQDRGTDIVLHIDKESEEYLEEAKIEELLRKYCKYLPIEIAFGKEKEWKDGKEIETDKDRIINDTKPAWTKAPTELSEEDYKKFYHDLYPVAEDPLFHIHLNVDYPFKLTGILYFPKIKKNIDIQRNKIQLYCNQVFVTDSVEGIVPEFLTLLHGVIDSPDIPLNVSRSYLQSDSNVKKISSHINKKVADRLKAIFKEDRKEFEKKWSDLKLFIEYGIVTNDKFYDRAKDIVLFQNVDGKNFTIDEYKNIIKDNQTDKDKKLVHLYTTNKEEQYTFIQAAKDKGYDVLLMDGQLDVHFMNHLEQKLTDSRFVRVDADVIDKLIPKDETKESKLSKEQQNDLAPVFESQLEDKAEHFSVLFEPMAETETPIVITQSEFMRRMKDMSEMSGGGYNLGNLPDSYNLVVNANHPLVHKIAKDKDEKLGGKLKELKEQLKPVEEEKNKIEKEQADKKEEEIVQADKDKKEELENKVRELKDNIDLELTQYGKQNKIVKQIIDLAFLANGLLKGPELTKFVKRSIDLIDEEK